MLLPPLTDLFIYLFIFVYSGPGDKTGYRGSNGRREGGRKERQEEGCSWKRWPEGGGKGKKRRVKGGEVRKGPKVLEEQKGNPV